MDVLAQGGWSVSAETITKMVRSVTLERRNALKKLLDPGLCAIAYDNLDFNFKTKEPSDNNQGTFRSITMGMFIPLTHGTTPMDIQYSKELWEKSTLNPKRPNDSKPPTPPSVDYLMDWIQAAQGEVKFAMEWLIQKILVDKYLPQHKKNLGRMPSTLNIGIEKTVQYPARAMHLSAATNDDNISIVQNLEKQIGTHPAWFEQHVRLCHGDLGMQE